MAIFTSRYGNKALAAHPGLKVATSLGLPRFPIQYEVVLMKQLAPDHAFLKAPYDSYKKQYRAKLDRIGFQAIYKMFAEIQRQHGVEDLILLCFEDVRKSGEWCHRRMFAEWWLQHCGEMIEELEPGAAYDPATGLEWDDVNKCPKAVGLPATHANQAASATATVAPEPPAPAVQNPGVPLEDQKRIAGEIFGASAATGQATLF